MFDKKGQRGNCSFLGLFRGFEGSIVSLKQAAPSSRRRAQFVLQTRCSLLYGTFALETGGKKGNFETLCFLPMCYVDVV